MTFLSAVDRADLEARWNEPHRVYHTLRHLRECLEHFARVRESAQDLDVVESAMWFHDAIHDARRDDNEHQSALLAREMLLARGVAPAQIARVEAIILATRHAGPSEDPDAQLVCDIDLAVLGAAPPRFDQYERDVRAEYAWVPLPIFRVKRAEILMRFLATARIYQTEAFHEQYDEPARHNLSRSLAALRGS